MHFITDYNPSQLPWIINALLCILTYTQNILVYLVKVCLFMRWDWVSTSPFPVCIMLFIFHVLMFLWSAIKTSAQRNSCIKEWQSKHYYLCLGEYICKLYSCNQSTTLQNSIWSRHTFNIKQQSHFKIISRYRKGAQEFVYSSLYFLLTLQIQIFNMMDNADTGHIQLQNL
jgi:hypothetical protein